MKSVCFEQKTKVDMRLIEIIEEKYGIKISDEIISFWNYNAGGIPKKTIITANSEEYEIRTFLSFDETDKYYYIKPMLESFLEETNGLIIPFAVDSGSNYYCINNENGKIYYWSHSDDEYYLMCKDIEEFISCF